MDAHGASSGSSNNGNNNDSNRDEGGAYVFEDHAALIAHPVAMTEKGHNAARVHGQEPIRLLKWINLDVLIRRALELKGPTKAR